jgi:hypothetical protein
MATKAIENIQSEYKTHSEELIPALNRLSGLQDELTVITKNIHDHCYHPIALVTNEEYKAESDKVERINHDLQKMHDDFFSIEKKLDTLGIDSSGIASLRQSFAQMLLCGTIHEKDLKKITEKIMGILDKIRADVPQVVNLCDSIQKNLTKIESDLLHWRKSTMKYLLSLAARFGATLVTGSLSAAVPVVPALGAVIMPQIVPHMSGVMEHSISLIEKTPEYAFSFISNKKSEKLSSEPLLRVPEKKPKESLLMSGVQHVLIDLKSSDEKKAHPRLMINSEHLWQTLLIMDFATQWLSDNKDKMAIAALSGVVGAILTGLGITSPLGLVLLAGGSTLAYLSSDAFKEFKHISAENEIIDQVLKELTVIEERFQLLEAGSYRKNIFDYPKETLAFVNEELAKLTPSTISVFLQYLSGNKESQEKIQALSELKRILEDKSSNGFSATIEWLKIANEKTDMTEVKTHIEKARGWIEQIEVTLSEIGVGPSPFVMKHEKALEDLALAEDRLKKPFDDVIEAKKRGVPGISSSLNLSMTFFQSSDVTKAGESLVKAQWYLKDLEKVYKPATEVSFSPRPSS